MSQFSISAGVTVTENEVSQYTSSTPSSLTGLLIRADTGYANKRLPFKNEGDILTLFNKPTKENYNDWFQAWNFTQYASVFSDIGSLIEGISF